MYYFSYAANLNRSHMARLCPGAVPLFPAVLDGYTLTVRQWFNVESREGSVVYGGVWEIGEEELHRLDVYEDCPELYGRRTVEVLPFGTRGRGDTETRGKTLTCLAYVMKEPFAIPMSPPDAEYLEMVREGYRDWGMPMAQLEAALGQKI